MSMFVKRNFLHSASLPSCLRLSERRSGAQVSVRVEAVANDDAMCSGVLVVRALRAQGLEKVCGAWHTIGTRVGPDSV